MFNKIKFLIQVLTVSLVTNAFAQSEPILTRTSNPIRWDKRKVYVCLDVTAYKLANIESAMSLAINEWNEALDNSAELILTNKDCDVNVYYEYIDYDDGYPLAITKSKYYLNGKIVSSRVTVNNNYPFGDASVKNQIFDLQSLLAHELGHVLGLDEDYKNNHTVMTKITRRGTIHKRNLHSEDVLAIKKLYGEK